MRDDHIINMLEEQGVGRLSEAEISVIESHTSGCQDCLRAYEAARISAALIQSRAAETVEASPFFKTRVMAAIRERRLSTEQPAIVRMWRAAGSLVSTMAVLVVILVGMTVFNFDTDSQVQNPELIAGQSIYSAEYVLFDQGEADDDGLQYDQVLATIYESGDGDGQ
jgi:hypothetical protein